MIITDKYVFFYKNYLSQWHRSDFYDKHSKIIFPYAEKCMMYYKALLFNDLDKAAEILKAEHPKDDQKLGREIKNFNQNIWDNSKTSIVFYANLLKFSQNPALMQKLLSFDDNITFVEASPTDLIWGVGLDENDEKIIDEKNWRGKNLLGKIITEVKINIGYYTNISEIDQTIIQILKNNNI